MFIEQYYNMINFNLLTNLTFTLFAFSDVYDILSYGRVKTYINSNLPKIRYIQQI